MDDHGSEVAGERRYSQGDTTRRSSLHWQSTAPLPGRYAELMQKYPRAFKLQLDAAQDRMFVDSRDHITVRAQPQTLETPRSGRSEAPTAGSPSPDAGHYRDDLSHIIAVLARSLASRNECLPQHESTAFVSMPRDIVSRPKLSDARSEQELQAAAVGNHSDAGFSPAYENTSYSRSDHKSGDISESRDGSDLRSRLQRNKEVMQKLLGNGLPFRQTSMDAPLQSRDFEEVWEAEPHDGVTSTSKTLPRTTLRLSREVASTSNKCLPRTRLSSYEPLRTASNNRGSYKVQDAVQLVSTEPRSTDVVCYDCLNAVPLVTGSYYTGLQPTVSSRELDVQQEPQHRREKLQPSDEDSACRQLCETYLTESCLSSPDRVVEAGATSDDPNCIIWAASTSYNHAAPKLKKSKSAKAFRAAATHGGCADLQIDCQTSRSSKKSHSILRNSQSFGGSTGKAGRVRFLETPDTIDETEPRLAELKLLSENSVFEYDSCECENNGIEKRQIAANRKHRPRRPSAMRSLASPQAPPKPARLHLSREHDDGPVSNNNALDDPSQRGPEDGTEKSADTWLDMHSRAEIANLASTTDACFKSRIGDHDSTSRLNNEPSSDGDMTPHISANNQRSTKVKSSRRTKLAASDFDHPYPASVSDVSDQLLKPMTGSERVLPSSDTSAIVKDEDSLLLTANEPTDDFLCASAFSDSSDGILSSDALRSPTTSGKSNQQKSSTSFPCREITMDIPGSILDGVGEAAGRDERCDRQLISDGLGEAAGIAAENIENPSRKDLVIPIYDLDDQSELSTAEVVEPETDASSHKPNRLSRSDLKPIHGRLSGSQQSLSERMGSLRRAARGAIKSIRRAMSLERLSAGGRRSMRTDAGGDSSSDAADAPTASTVPVLTNVQATSLTMPPSPSSTVNNMPSVKKSLSLRSIGKLSFKKRASYDVNPASEVAQPAATRTVHSPLRVSSRSGLENLRLQPVQPASSSLETSVDHPKNFRAIGKLLEWHEDGTITIKLQRPPHGPFGFYVGRDDKNAATVAPPATDAVSAVCITRLSDSYPEKLFSGLLAVGDELLEVNRRPVTQLSLNDIYDIIATTADCLLLRIRPLRAQAASRADSPVSSG